MKCVWCALDCCDWVVIRAFFCFRVCFLRLGLLVLLFLVSPSPDRLFENWLANRHRMEILQCIRVTFVPRNESEHSVKFPPHLTPGVTL